MELPEKVNPKLKRILNKNYAQLQIEQNKLADVTGILGEQFEELHRLEHEIRKNLSGLGYEI